jgi:hypothetical protein
MNRKADCRVSFIPVASFLDAVAKGSDLPTGKLLLASDYIVDVEQDRGHLDFGLRGLGKSVQAPRKTQVGAGVSGLVCFGQTPA